MEGKVNAFFADRSFGFITDENGENRYFHLTKVVNPAAIKIDAEVTFKPIEREQGLGAVDIKVHFHGEHIFIADEKIKIAAIKQYNIYQKMQPLAREIKDNTIVSIGLLMNRIKPETAKAPAETEELLTYLEIELFHAESIIFTSHEIDIDEALSYLQLLPIRFIDKR
ncbi:cold-shock protein [Thorsellia anophelis]|uniref:'Cold-shock' DNA-binding domain-containing protein n=1 Tax=Thorsellia anophelis DSM 18579 TaxID=1123402 RepID=A0A1I0BMM7_9GAMM|nr:cold shock domain-containing protein [Thorsellia anophelis]SET07519.1 'Cold-shock' DNA-binding domain-containing protein [Thorsellia anophelis DSM 18579]